MITNKAYNIKNLLEKNGFSGLVMMKFTPVDENQWEVDSESGKTYTISKIRSKFICGCPQYKFRHKECKHLNMFHNWYRLKEKEKTI